MIRLSRERLGPSCRRRRSQSPMARDRLAEQVTALLAGRPRPGFPPRWTLDCPLPTARSCWRRYEHVGHRLQPPEERTNPLPSYPNVTRPTSLAIWFPTGDKVASGKVVLLRGCYSGKGSCRYPTETTGGGPARRLSGGPRRSPPEPAGRDYRSRRSRSPRRECTSEGHRSRDSPARRRHRARSP